MIFGTYVEGKHSLHGLDPADVLTIVEALRRKATAAHVAGCPGVASTVSLLADDVETAVTNPIPIELDSGESLE